MEKECILKFMTIKRKKSDAKLEGIDRRKHNKISRKNACKWPNRRLTSRGKIIYKVPRLLASNGEGGIEYNTRSNVASYLFLAHSHSWAVYISQ